MTFQRIGIVLLGLTGCGPAATDPEKMDQGYEDRAVTQTHAELLANVDDLVRATEDLQAAAPAPVGRGWDPQRDADALVAMREAWVRARTAYELVEGAIAPLFPDIDAAIDARYDDFLTELESQGGDPNLFDGKGVTGMHAVERILYSDVTPQRVIDFEKVIPGYVKAGFPGTEQEASDFRSALAPQLVSDAGELQMLWVPSKVDPAVAFYGVVSLMNEQREKVVKASSNEEESRYAQRTMADLRDNLAGTRKVYRAFQPWILSKSSTDATKDGATIDAKIANGFAALDQAYQAVSGDAMPEVPATWSAEMPSAADLATPFGRLYAVVTTAVDPTQPDSIVAQMNDAATLLGLEAR